MITRGYYIGEIIDELAGLDAQVKTRNRLGLTDLTVYAENFFRDILNILLNANLKNLNAERANEPGLDLGDKSKKLAIQVTSTGTTQKVDKTLEKITEQQTKDYSRVVVLVIGQGQGSYSPDSVLAAKVGFSAVRDIWNMESLSRLALSLEIAPLQELHRLIRSNCIRLRVELEIPDEDGTYPTNGFDQWEAIPAATMGSGAVFCDFCDQQSGESLTEAMRAETLDDLTALAATLSKLPRITREFLAMLYERRETSRRPMRRNKFDLAAHVLYPKLERLYQGAALDDELAILNHAGIVKIDGDDPHEYGPTEVFMDISENENIAAEFISFIETKGHSYRKVIGQVDFSAF
jgi:hypothetical protein